MSGENPILERDGTEAAFPYIGEDTNNDGKVDKVPSKIYGVNSNGDPVPLEVDENNNLKTNLIEKVVIKGKDGENEIPVKVDNEGRLVLASDVNVETGDINVGTVEQGGIGEGAEPWEVKQTGSIVEEDVETETFDEDERKTIFDLNVEDYKYVSVGIHIDGFSSFTAYMDYVLRDSTADYSFVARKMIHENRLFHDTGLIEVEKKNFRFRFTNKNGDGTEYTFVLSKLRR